MTISVGAVRHVRVDPTSEVDHYQVKQPFNFRYKLWKPSRFAIGLEQHSRDTSWRTFRVGELLCGVTMMMDDADMLRAEIYADGTWTPGSRDRLTARLIHSYGLDDHANKAELAAEFQTIKGVGPYTAAIIASHAVRDPSALGLT